MSDAPQTTSHAVIAGYGVPGRACGGWCAKQGMSVCIVELNEKIVERVSAGGFEIILGSVSDESVLKQAGIERASIFAVTVPNDEAALAATAIARKLNPNVRILTRCAYISRGMEAMKRGANQVVIAEQVVAEEFLKILPAPE